jgi:lipoprotein NlpD
VRGAISRGAAFAAALSFLSCAGAPPAPDADWAPYSPPRTTWSPGFGGVYHTVERGQTLWRIARAYGVDLDRLQWVNDIEDVSKVAAGRKLFVPGARETLAVTPYRPGETAPPATALAQSLIWPLLPRQVTGKRFSSLFGPRPGETHTGVDLPAMEGTPLEAAGDGTVVFAGAGMSGYGNVVVVKHNEDWSTVYAHNAINLVKEGQVVEQGQVIAEVGRTGRATGPHLHFEVRRRGVPQDPIPLLPKWQGP